MDINERELDRQHERYLEPPDDSAPVRAKISITFEMEYTIKSEYYPDGMTADEMVELDVESYKEDFMLLIDNENTKITKFEGEVL